LNSCALWFGKILEPPKALKDTEGKQTLGSFVLVRLFRASTPLIPEQAPRDWVTQDGHIEQGSSSGPDACGGPQPRHRVIGGIDGVGEQELSLAFGGIDLEREDQGRPELDPPSQASAMTKDPFSMP